MLPKDTVQQAVFRHAGAQTQLHALNVHPESQIGQCKQVARQQFVQQAGAPTCMCTDPNATDAGASSVKQDQWDLMATQEGKVCT